MPLLDLNYTSGRIVSQQSFRYGIFEIRAKLPRGKGISSAVWFLSAKRPLNWPDDGEIGIKYEMTEKYGIYFFVIYNKRFLNNLKIHL